MREAVLQQEVLQILISVIVVVDFLDKTAKSILALLIPVIMRDHVLELKVDQIHLLVHVHLDGLVIYAMLTLVIPILVKMVEIVL